MLHVDISMCMFGAVQFLSSFTTLIFTKICVFDSLFVVHVIIRCLPNREIMLNLNAMTLH